MTTYHQQGFSTPIRNAQASNTSAYRPLLNMSGERGMKSSNQFESSSKKGGLNEYNQMQNFSSLTKLPEKITQPYDMSKHQSYPVIGASASRPNEPVSEYLKAQGRYGHTLTSNASGHSATNSFSSNSASGSATYITGGSSHHIDYKPLLSNHHELPSPSSSSHIQTLQNSGSKQQRFLSPLRQIAPSSGEMRSQFNGQAGTGQQLDFGVKAMPSVVYSNQPQST